MDFSRGTQWSDDTAWPAHIRAQQQPVLDNGSSAEGCGRGQGWHQGSQKGHNTFKMLQTNHFLKKKKCIPLLLILLKNELASCSPYSQSHFPSQKSEQTDEQVPVRSRLTFLTLIPRLRLMLCWAGQHRAGRWGLSCCSATLTAAAPKQILGSFSPTCVAASLEYLDQMKEAGLFAWTRHDLLPAGSAAAENKGRINPTSHPAWVLIFSQPCHCDQWVPLEKIERNIGIILQAEDEITSYLLFL